MANVTTFTSLKDELRRYLERGFTEQDDPLVYQELPRLINKAERRISRELKIQGFIAAVNITFTEGVSVYAKPDRWRDTISMTVTTASGRLPIFTRSYEYIRNYWPNEADTSTPQFYADYDYSHWLIAPTPSADIPAEILYYQMPAPLDENNQTNWLTAYAPELLLYGSLLEATVFLKNDERMQIWQSLYDRTAQATNNQDIQKILDRDANRTEA